MTGGAIPALPPPTLPPAEVRGGEEAERVWRHVVERLAELGVSAAAVTMWVEPLAAIGSITDAQTPDGPMLCVQGPQHVTRWFRRRYGSLAGTIVRTEETFTGLRIYDLPRAS